MAYLNEFPHTEASKLNLDWLLEQYSTFNQRLEEIVQHFDESVQEMESDILQFKADYETAFNNFKHDITSLVNEYSEKVDSINENIGGYVNEYLTENINTILVDNPVLDTKFQRVGTIPTGESLSINLTQNRMYEIVYLDYQFNYVKYLVSNDTYRIIARTYDNIPTTITNEMTQEVVMCSVPVVLPSTLGETINVSLSDLTFTIENGKPNTLTVYMKELI